MTYHELRVLAGCQAEFREAARYHETESSGVGIAFIAEVRRAVGWIMENPNAAVEVGNGVRSKILNHFPYNILYAVEHELILIVAVAHQKRRPRYWRARIRQIKERQTEQRVEDWTDRKCWYSTAKATTWF